MYCPGLRIDSKEATSATAQDGIVPPLAVSLAVLSLARCNAKLCAARADADRRVVRRVPRCNDRSTPGAPAAVEDPCARFRMEGDFEAWEDCMETADPHEVFAARVAERFDAMCAGDVGMSLLSSGIGGLAGLALGYIVALLASKSKMFKSIRWRSPPSARRPYGGGGIRQPSWLPAGHTPAGRSRTQSP